MTGQYSRQRDRTVIRLAAFLVAFSMAGCMDSLLGPGSKIPVVSGTVRDAASSATIPGATVEVGDHSTVSAADGSYSFGSMEFNSSLKIRARKDGYVEYATTIDASRENAGYGVFHDIRMSRSAVQ